jgi:hypothetical protein
MSIVMGCDTVYTDKYVSPLQYIVSFISAPVVLASFSETSSCSTCVTSSCNTCVTCVHKSKPNRVTSYCEKHKWQWCMWRLPSEHVSTLWPAKTRILSLVQSHESTTFPHSMTTSCWHKEFAELSYKLQLSSTNVSTRINKASKELGNQSAWIWYVFVAILEQMTQHPSGSFRKFQSAC